MRNEGPILPMDPPERRLPCGCVIAIMLILEAAAVLGALKWLGYI